MTNVEIIADNNPLAGLIDDRESAAKYLSMFVDESERCLDEITDAMLSLEAGRGEKNLERLFIAAHRLKGSAASIGLDRTAKLAHLAEDLLQDLVDSGKAPTPEASDAILMFADELRRCLETIKQGQFETGGYEAVAQELLAARDQRIAISAERKVEAPRPSSFAASPSSDQTTSLPPELHRRVASAMGASRDPALVGQVIFEPKLLLVGLKARLVYEKLSNLGRVRYFNPPIEVAENCEEIDSVMFGVAAEQSPEVAKDMVRVAGIRRMTIEPLVRPDESPSEAPPESVPAAGDARPAETLRVEVERLDQLMGLVGQLSMGRSRLAEAVGRLRGALANRQTTDAALNDLTEALHALDRIGDGLQRTALDMRMVPIGPLFMRFHRVVRDIARSSGKDIRLKIDGEKTELDKRMIDELADPLIHAIRNAADHGIEPPEARLEAGKPRQGTISLDACHRGGSIVINISDDGRGLDGERLRARAVEMGFVAPAEAQAMTLQELCRFVWMPGFSTARNVSEVSGRGIGMDIVRLKIEELGGSVDLDTEPGQGTTVTITLPLTLAILPSLLMEIRGEAYAVPMESVVEIICVGPRDTTTVFGHPGALVRGQMLPIITLDAVFDKSKGNARGEDARSAAPDQNGFAAAGTTLVLLGPPERRIGLAVDRVLGEEDVVVKSIAANYRNITGLAGAGIRGNGRVFLILDPDALLSLQEASK